MDSGHHKLSENIWFVWSKMSYNGDMDGCHACARTTECEDRARILETEFAIEDLTLDLRSFYSVMAVFDHDYSDL